MDLHCDVIMDDISTHPECPHGPTLLFKRQDKYKERRFFACAACRDRKLCSFFHWADEKFTAEKRKNWAKERLKLLPKVSHKKLYSKFLAVCQELSDKRRIGYCHSCPKLLLSTEIQEHSGHEITCNISQYQLSHPSELLKPLETKKKEAQYLFSKSTRETIVHVAENIGVKNFICIGAPRIHEFIHSDYHGNMRSILLDIDQRYQNFYSEDQFCWFNAFNNYFFNPDCSTKVFNEYLQQNNGEGMMIVLDPPFGGRVEPLARTLLKIQQLHRKLNPHIDKDMPVMLIYPYFMEHHILASCPDYQMLDYKVQYENHPSFSQGSKSRKLGSPVRIFTNIPPQDAPLPQSEGYSFCKPCRRWVSQENSHCQYCKKCASKNGCTYIHCFKCNRCVKPTWKHCNKCQHCCVMPHKCGSFVPSSLCYNCGESGHKKYDCPLTSTEKEQISGGILNLKRNSIETLEMEQNHNFKRIKKNSAEKKNLDKKVHRGELQDKRRKELFPIARRKKKLQLKK